MSGGILIAAMNSGAGKTTASCAILSALRKRGLSIRSFKCGPDYIDTMFHRAINDGKGGNLDSYFMDWERISEVFHRQTEGVDFVLAEGAMGFYDGINDSLKGSAFEIAETLDFPVLLLVDGKGAGLSVCASIQGMLSFSSHPRRRIAGILLNRVSPPYYPRLKKMIEEHCGIPVYGYIPELPAFRLPERHLGLFLPGEMPRFRDWEEGLGRQVEDSIDLDGILLLGNSAGWAQHEMVGRNSMSEYEKRYPEFPALRIAVASDEAFCFYYEEDRMLLRDMGATLVPFSPLSDSCLPEDIDGILIPGGYPEHFIRQLHDNVSMRRSIRSAIRNGTPCIAEGGGFLYLSHSLSYNGESKKMCGIFPGRGKIKNRLVRFGYVEFFSERGGMFGPAGTRLKGHEFHYFDTDQNGSGLLFKKAGGKTEWRGAFYTDVMYAGFPQLSFQSNPSAAASFLKSCESFRIRREAARRWDSLGKPLGSLGLLEENIIKICGIYRNSKPEISSKKALAVFCGDHGVVAEGVSQTDSSVSHIVTENFPKGKTVASRFAVMTGVDVFTVDTGLLGDHYPDKDIKAFRVIDRKIRFGTGNIAKEPAMSKEECLSAMACGREIVSHLKQHGYKLVCLGEMGIGNTTASTAMLAGLLLLYRNGIHDNMPVFSDGHDYFLSFAKKIGMPFQNRGRDDQPDRAMSALDLSARQLSDLLTGRGAGLSEDGLHRKRTAVRKALMRTAKKGANSPEDLLRELGGTEIAAMTGAILQAVQDEIPLLLDGAITAVAALYAFMMDARVPSFLIASHKPAEKTGRSSLRLLGLKPILSGNFYQGEGSGALLLLPLLDMAMDVYREMSTFQEISVKAYQRYDKLCGKREKGRKKDGK